MNDSVLFWFLLWAISTLFAITFLALLIRSEKKRVKIAKWSKEGKKYLYELRDDNRELSTANFHLRCRIEELEKER